MTTITVFEQLTGCCQWDDGDVSLRHSFIRVASHDGRADGRRLGLIRGVLPSNNRVRASIA